MGWSRHVKTPIVLNKLIETKGFVQVGPSLYSAVDGDFLLPNEIAQWVIWVKEWASQRTLIRLGSFHSSSIAFSPKKSILWDLLVGEINKSLFWVFSKKKILIREVIIDQRKIKNKKLKKLKIMICLFHQLCKNQQFTQVGLFFWWKRNIRGIKWA